MKSEHKSYWPRPPLSMLTMTLIMSQIVLTRKVINLTLPLKVANVLRYADVPFPDESEAMGPLSWLGFGSTVMARVCSRHGHSCDRDQWEGLGLQALPPDPSRILTLTATGSTIISRILVTNPGCD